MALNARFSMPQPQTPLIIAGNIPQKDWFLAFSNFYLAAVEGLPQTEVSIAAGASPFTYESVIRGQLLISGGTVTAIEFSRNGTTFYTTGQTSGFVQMDNGDFVRVTYAVAPTLTYFPM